MDLVLHPNTQETVSDFVRKPSHALLLSAPTGSGKYTLALDIAAKLLGIDSIALLSYPYFSVLEPVNGTIPIESVRELKNVLQLRTTGKAEIRRVIIVDHADSMTREAQNALLKMLEEPPKDTVIILTADSPRSLLPTIASRLQSLVVNKPSQQSVLKHFSSIADEQDIIKAYHISSGRIGLMHALLNKDEIHPLIEYIELAKEIITKPAYERLLRVNEISTQDVAMFISALYSVAHAALVASSEKGQAANTNRWYKTCQVIYKAEQDLRFKPSNKLLITNLFIRL